MKKQVDFARDYGNHVMEEIFVEANTTGKTAPLMSISEILNEISGGAVCISANSCTDVIANEICGSLNHKEVRQYILLSDKKSAKRILGKKYVRILTIPQNGMIVIHILNKKVRTWLFADASSQSGLEVTGNDIYKSFCNLFWSKKVDCEFRGDDNERDPDSPLTQDISVDDRCSMPGQATDMIERYNQDLYLQDIKSDVSTDRFAHLHVSEMSGVEWVCRAATGSVDLFDMGNVSGFSLVGDGKAGYLLPGHIDSNAVNWSIPLNNKTYEAMTGAFGRTWEYIKTTKLKETVGKKIRYADTFASTIAIESAATVEKDYRCESVEEYQDKSAIEESFMKTVDESRPASSRIEYHVTALPPLVPSKSKKDNLHTEWENRTNEWISTLEGLKADCGKYYDMVSTLGGKIVTSLGNRRNDLCAEIDSLANSKISIMSKPKRDQTMESYKNVCNKCETFRADCDKVIQEQKFIKDQKTRIQNLEGDISKLEEKIKESVKRIDELESSKAKEKTINKEKEELDRLRRSLAAKHSNLDTERIKIFKYEENALHSGNRIVAKSFSFPSEELPVYEAALLHTSDGVRYISIPDSSDESCLSDGVLLQDVQRLKAKLVVRE